MSTIHDKLASLLSMTVDRGCTEDEAETAMRMAANIAAKHGIDLDALRPAGAPKPKATRKRHTTELKWHQVFCAQAAAELSGVACHVKDLGRRGFEFIGRPENIDSAEQLMFWLFRQVEEIYKAALPKGLNQRERAEFRRTFKAACAQRVLERACRVMRDMVRKESSVNTTGHNALVVAGHFLTLKQEIDDELYGTAEERAARAKQWEEVMAKRKAEHDAWRAANPVEAAKRDEEERKENERWHKQQERNAKRRKGDGFGRERSMPKGSGTAAGYRAGDAVKLRKEVD